VPQRKRDGVLILSFDAPRITASSGAYFFREALHDAVDAGHLAIAINFAGVEYVDTRGLKAFWSGFKHLTSHHGHLCLFNVGHELHEFFQQLAVTEILDVCANEAEAVEKFDDRPKFKRREAWFLLGIHWVCLWAYKKGYISDRRRPGGRRIIPDRRRRPDRRSRDGGKGQM